MKVLEWAQATKKELGRIRGVCLDIDDTLSTRGKLSAEAYSALWDLKNAGFAVVPITGRPAGWCDHLARFWPVDAVVGENGAFTFFMQSGVRRRLNTPGAADDPKPGVGELARKIRERFPNATWASDQSYREYDLAIDVCEDVPPWPQTEIDELLELCKREGAHAKLSSIHVNAWFGDYDKRAGFENWIRAGAPGSSVPLTSLAGPENWLFIGDSPNDEPMFAYFRASVGVANLHKYLGRLTTPPRWITAGESGQGFAEMARRLIELSA